MAAGTNPRLDFDYFSCFPPNQINSTTKTAWGEAKGEVGEQKMGKTLQFWETLLVLPHLAAPTEQVGGIWAPQKCTWHLLLLSRESLAVLPLPQESGKFICRVYLFFSLLWNRWGGKGQKILCALRVPPVTVLSQGLTAEPFPGTQAKGTARKAPGSARENPEGTSLSLRGHSPAEQHQEQPGQVQEGEQHP